ncbi:precorrin-6Y C5,15-methyltransferase subunit CbiT [Pseudanabaena sp. FACHB-2040]|uniref:precorrin-6Y C5,15-methyltransferase subunit CbiT n=1 Tax=Pseudanabaena sp. FACHB-2040 TaxID=2692859 RepID=UPI001686AC62|nr:precorrin-6Y C5,15-methyltransferase subunit CbiT [Pseudanabaena sp. FACHB-2040]MBD2258628.1 precorrin-6Y C5,15-methyltransferase subunit CbiT [Pseudanabaena sp. FACHB-2040]
MTSLWPYVTPGIPDELFEQLPGIPLTSREVRLLLLGYLRLKARSVLWDVGAGTGTVAIEAALLCPQGQVVAVERDEEVASLIRRNCDLFGLKNLEVIEGIAPDCLPELPYEPDCILVEGGRPLKETLLESWQYLATAGRLAVTATNLETLYTVSETFAALRVRNVEAVQPAVNRLESRGNHQVFAAVDPIFILSGEKGE